VAIPDKAVGDGELARWAVRGDVGAFERLVERYRGEIARATLSYLRRREDAEDAVQETFARALEGMGRLENPEAIGPWLHGIAWNVCCEVLRQRSRLVFCDRRHDPVSASWHSAVNAWCSDRGRTAMQSMAALPIKERALLALYCLEGAPLQEVSDLFEVSLGAAKMRIGRAREMARSVPWQELVRPDSMRWLLSHAYYHLASLYFKREKWERVEHCWKRALAYDARGVVCLSMEVRPAIYDYFVHYRLPSRLDAGLAGSGADLPLSQQGIDAALSALYGALRRYPGHPGVWFAIGEILVFGSEDLEAGIAALDHAAGFQRYRHLALIRQAAALASAGHHERALGRIERIERERLWDREVPMARAFVFGAAGQRDIAVAEARKALLLANTDDTPFWTAHLHTIPGLVLGNCGHRKEARAALLSALEAGPPGPMRRAIERLLGWLVS